MALSIRKTMKQMKDFILPGKRTMMMNTLSSLPDDVFLIVLEYCEMKDIKNTRVYQSEQVQNCTEFITIWDAVTNGNVDNLIWLRRFNTSLKCKYVAHEWWIEIHSIWYYYIGTHATLYRLYLIPFFRLGSGNG